ncbi:hypothetical protein AYO44_02690 [Planctomycetaceae bacterium SCGC AG-212-F19]|nr:hypothetical protein AYO44_02690 [Planctomycetaceae bacterium SCGC AG-212-F19]
MNRPPGGSAQPLVLNSLDQLSCALDKAANGGEAPPAPAVKIMHLPDTVPSRRQLRQAEQSAAAAAPWWVDVEPAPANAAPNQAEPIVVIGELDEEPPSRIVGLVNWRVIGSVTAAAVVVLSVVVFGAWAATGGATPVAQAAPRPAEAPAAEAKPPAAAIADQKLTEIENKYQAIIAKLEAAAPRPAEPTPPPKEEPVAQPAAVADAKPAKACFGTAVNFAGTPIEAAEEAVKDKKLLMVLTISGNFEESKFT